MDYYMNFVKVTKDNLINFIQNSKERIIIAKPGYYLDEINSIINQIIKKGVKVTLYLEEGDQAVRFGFGDEDALKTLMDNLNLLEVQTANHIRLSVIICDDEILVFVPAALSWEDEPMNMNFPNGLLGGIDLVNKMLYQLDQSKIQFDSNEDLVELVGFNENNPIDKNIASFISFKAIKEKKEIVQRKIAESIKTLENNPAADPTRLKQTTFYRNNYKLIHVTVKGMINNKKIDLSPFNRLIKSTDERLKSSWRLFTNIELNNVQEYKDHINQIERIKRKYTLDAKKFGLLIDVNNIIKLNKELNATKDCLINKIREKDSANATSLSKMTNDSLEALLDYMINVDKYDVVLNSNRFIKSKYREKNDYEKSKREAMKMFIMERLKFPLTEELIENIDIDSYTVDISDELLHENIEFKELLLRHATPDENGLKIRSYSDGYEKN